MQNKEIKINLYILGLKTLFLNIFKIIENKAYTIEKNRLLNLYFAVLLKSKKKLLLIMQIFQKRKKRTKLKLP